MKILLIETATQVCSVAIADGDTVVAHCESDEPNAHSSHLVPFIDQMLGQLHLTTRDLDAVCVSSGPGSYTGLRIGVSSAKGICYALGVPLVAVPTLLGMASLYYRCHPQYHGMVCPMIDARRMECYTMVAGRVEGDEPRAVILRDTRADIFDAAASSAFNELLDRGEMTFIGDGAAKTRPIFAAHPNARYDDSFAPLAEGLLPVALQRLADGRTEDVAYFEPFYLKDFVAKKSVVHGLR